MKYELRRNVIIAATMEVGIITGLPETDSADPTYTVSHFIQGKLHIDQMKESELLAEMPEDSNA
jgi:hypothetical protein